MSVEDGLRLAFGTNAKNKPKILATALVKLAHLRRGEERRQFRIQAQCTCRAITLHPSYHRKMYILNMCEYKAASTLALAENSRECLFLVSW